MADTNMERLVVSKDRVAQHGEVYTGAREVNGMLGLVEHETERIDSRFLEPACGHGNFLEAVLRRKLGVVVRRYSRSQLEYERYSVIAVTSLYGIDILPDNVQACRSRLLGVYEAEYRRLFDGAVKSQCLAAVEFILHQNIVWGDALTLTTADDSRRPITFTEWSPVNGSLLKRRDFTFEGLLQSRDQDLPLLSDLGSGAVLPTPAREYPAVHFLELTK